MIKNLPLAQRASYRSEPLRTRRCSSCVDAVADRKLLQVVCQCLVVGKDFLVCCDSRAESVWWTVVMTVVGNSLPVPVCPRPVSHT